MHRWYGFTKDACYFCGHKELFATNEHYYFCPDCMALYTFLIVHKGCGSVGNCVPVNSRIPTAFHPPRYKAAKKKVFIKDSITFKDRWCCSKCGGEVMVDGW